MTIQFNTDKTINGDERNINYFTNLISDTLKNYSSHITRIEVHLSDENGIKDGVNDIRCLIEVRLEKKQPIVASHQSEKVEPALSGALKKLKASLKTKIERTANH